MLNFSSSIIEMDEHDIVSEKDLAHLLHILDWQNQMECTASNTIYQSWHHEPKEILNFLYTFHKFDIFIQDRLLYNLSEAFIDFDIFLII